MKFDRFVMHIINNDLCTIWERGLPSPVLPSSSPLPNMEGMKEFQEPRYLWLSKLKSITYRWLCLSVCSVLIFGLLLIYVGICLFVCFSLIFTPSVAICSHCEVHLFIYLFVSLSIHIYWKNLSLLPGKNELQLIRHSDIFNHYVLLCLCYVLLCLKMSN